MKVLILRARPGADETAARARALGLEPIVAPLFAVRPIAWEPPDASRFDALFLTSAHSARLGGDGLRSYFALPCYAVGERTAQAARDAGFADIRVGPSNGAALAQMAAGDGVKAALHLGARDHIAPGPPVVAHVSVYAADAAGPLPGQAEDSLVLLHSPRAAALFAALAGDRRGAIRIAAISAQAARAGGEGWRSVDVAPAPRDQALLELAAKLCKA
jgi:uroporphyrinogen-III synthase